MCDQKTETLTKIDTLIASIEKLTMAMAPKTPATAVTPSFTFPAPKPIDYVGMVARDPAYRRRVLSTLTVREMMDRAHELGLHIDVYGAASYAARKAA